MRWIPHVSAEKPLSEPDRRLDGFQAPNGEREIQAVDTTVGPVVTGCGTRIGTVATFALSITGKWVRVRRRRVEFICRFDRRSFTDTASRRRQNRMLGV